MPRALLLALALALSCVAACAGPQPRPSSGADAPFTDAGASWGFEATWGF